MVTAVRESATFEEYQKKGGARRQAASPKKSKVSESEIMKAVEHEDQPGTDKLAGHYQANRIYEAVSDMNNRLALVTGYLRKQCEQMDKMLKIWGNEA